jgi:DNA-binding NtrC family response regulator
MPAPIILVHDDRKYLANTHAFLSDAGYEVASFINSLEALNALEAAKTVDLLIVRLQMPPGMPNGLSLASMTRQRRVGIKLLMLADAGLADFVDIEGQVFPTATPLEGELLAAVKGLLVAEEDCASN